MTSNLVIESHKSIISESCGPEAGVQCGWMLGPKYHQAKTEVLIWLDSHLGTSENNLHPSISVFGWILIMVPVRTKSLSLSWLSAGGYPWLTEATLSFVICCFSSSESALEPLTWFKASWLQISFSRKSSDSLKGSADGQFSAAWSLSQS